MSSLLIRYEHCSRPESSTISFTFSKILRGFSGSLHCEPRKGTKQTISIHPWNQSQPVTGRVQKWESTRPSRLTRGTSSPAFGASVPTTPWNHLSLLPVHKSRPSSGWKQKIRAPPPSAVIDRMFNVMFGRLSFVPDL